MSRTYRHRNKKKSKSNSAKKAPIVSYKTAIDITKSKESEIKLDKNKNIVYSSKYIGDEKFEYWVEYNSNNNPTFYYDSRGMWWKCKYNSNGNISYYWDSTGYEEIYNYYKGNTVIRTDSYGNKTKCIIDKNKYTVTRDLFSFTSIYN